MSVDRDHDVRDADIHALVRLSREVSELGDDARSKREHALLGLTRMCNADKAVFVEFRKDHRTGDLAAAVASVQFLDTPEHERQRLTRFYDRNEPRDPMIEFMSRAGNDVMVGRPCDILGERVWRSSEHYNEIRRPAGIVEQLYAYSRIGGVACGIGLHRRDNRPFQKRELRLMDAFMHGAGSSLHVASKPKIEDASAIIDPVSLPPRLAAVLARFMRGETEKMAAQHLGITHHTVHSYAKQIYRRLGVSSRSELLARYIRKQDGQPRE